MSLRFSLYAIDLPRFKDLLRVSLAELLRRYSDQGRQEFPGFSFHDVDFRGGNRWYYARPREILVHDTTRRDGDQVLNHKVSEQELAGIPYLRRSLREQIEASNSAALWNVCDAFGDCNGADFVVPLLRGYKFGPPQALFKIAEEVFGDDQGRCRRLIDLFQRVYREYATDLPFQGRLYELSDFEFPVKPSEEGLGQLSVWTSEEVRFLVETLEQLCREESARAINLYRTLIMPDEECERYYREMIQGLLRLRGLQFEDPRVVGFVKH